MNILKDYTITYAWKDGKGDQIPNILGINDQASYRRFNFNWFRASIESVKKLGYRIAMYTDKEGLPYWEDYPYIDELIEVPKDFYPYYYDSYKYYPHYTRDDVINIDHDILMHHKLPNFKEDVIGDALLDRYDLYNNINKDFKVYEKHNVESVIPEWNYLHENKTAPCINSGFVLFNNLEFKKLFLERWDKFHDFCASNSIVSTHIGCPTIISTELFLGLLSESHGYSKTSWHSKHKEEYYYNHYVGELKYTHRHLVANYKDNQTTFI
jgi:hypothetical protein